MIKDEEGIAKPLAIKEWCTIVQDNVDFMYSTMEAGGKIVSVSAISGIRRIQSRRPLPSNGW